MQQQADEDELGLSSAALEALKEFALEHDMLGELPVLQHHNYSTAYYAFTLWSVAGCTRKMTLQELIPFATQACTEPVPNPPY